MAKLAESYGVIMAELRVLNDSGKAEFLNYLNLLKDDGTKATPVKELSSDKYSSRFTPKIEIEQIDFKTRHSMGLYLVKKLKDVSKAKIITNDGLWNWLALAWFDLVCPVTIHGKRKVRQIARYICSSDYRNYYRHYIASNYLLMDLLGSDSSKIFLYSPPHIHNDFIEQVASRQDLITNRGLIMTINHLYWSSELERPKPNASNREVKGNLRRLLILFQQLELTYDTRIMSYEEIEKILPPEYDQWKND